MITIAVPKGRLLANIQRYFAERGMPFDFEGRQLISADRVAADDNGDGTDGSGGIGGRDSGAGDIRWILVKNSDVPTYVSSATAALGIVGSDILDEQRHRLFRHLAFPFGEAKMCLINGRDDNKNQLHNGVKIASKYTVASRRYLSQLGISGSIYTLNGSLELAPLLGLAPFIIDIVQTGKTLASNNLKICAEIMTTQVHLVSNPAYYKVYYKSVDTLIHSLRN